MALHNRDAVTVSGAVATRSRADLIGMEDQYQPKHSPSQFNDPVELVHKCHCTEHYTKDMGKALYTQCLFFFTKDIMYVVGPYLHVNLTMMIIIWTHCGLKKKLQYYYIIIIRIIITAIIIITRQVRLPVLRT